MAERLRKRRCTLPANRWLTRSRSEAEEQAQREKKFGAVKKEPTDDMDESVSEALRLPLNMQEDAPADDAIVFTTTTEFCRGLDTTQSLVETRKRDAEARENAARDTEDVVMKLEEGAQAAADDDDDEEDEGVLDEPKLTGMAAALEMVKRRGLLMERGEEEFGRARDKPSDTKDVAPGVRLEYRDAEGRLLKPKEAFRELCHQFHGHTSGAKKREKREKAILLEQKSRMLDVAGGQVQRHQVTKRKLGQSYLVLEAAHGSNVAAPATEKKDGVGEKKDRRGGSHTATGAPAAAAAVPLKGHVKSFTLKKPGE